MRRYELKRFLVCLLLLTATAAIRAEDTPPRIGPQPLADTLGPPVEIMAYDHGDVSKWAEFFLFDRPSHPKIQQLRREYKLDEVVRDSNTDVDRAVAIKAWTFGSLVYGIPTSSSGSLPIAS